MIIADFETYTNKLDQIKPYLFAMFTHCIFNEDNNELTFYTGKNCLDYFFTHLKYQVNKIDRKKQDQTLILTQLHIKTMPIKVFVY